MVAALARDAPLDEHTLEAQQELLALEAAGVAAERPARPQHAVAGHDDRHRVRAERVAGGAHRARAPGAGRPSRRRWSCGRSRSAPCARSTRRVKPRVSAQSIGRSNRSRSPSKYSSSSRRVSSSRAGASSMPRRQPRAHVLEHVVAVRTACRPRAPARAAWRRRPAGRAASRPWRRPRRAARRRRRARASESAQRRRHLGEARSRRPRRAVSISFMGSIPLSVS